MHANLFQKDAIIFVFKSFSACVTTGNDFLNSSKEALRGFIMASISADGETENAVSSSAHFSASNVQ